MTLGRVRQAAPELTGSALAAVRHRGTHVQIIAAAGSGKTEVVSQRVAELLTDGCLLSRSWRSPSTGRTADELETRIAHRVEDRLGAVAALFVGTIGAFCFRLLQ